MSIVTAAATPTPVLPLAPFSVSVLIVSIAVDATVIAETLPPIWAPSASVASRLRSITLTATEAPTPTSLPDPPPLLSGAALAESAAVDWVIACSEPPESAPASVALAPLRISARVSSLTMLIATEPATPISPPPAPLLALASVVWVVSPPTLVIVAPSCRPSAVIATPEATTASLVVLATLIATAAPTASPSSLVVALPSAVAWPSVLVLAWTETFLASVEIVPALMRALLVASVISTATAAATLMVSLLPLSPLLVSVLATPAVGVAEPVDESRAPPEPAALSPRPRPAAVFLLTPSSSALLFLSSCSPPTALASALAVVPTWLLALTLTAPLLLSERARSAVEWSISTLTATEAPMAASLLPSALPLALVVLVERRSALMARSPLAFSRLPAPRRAMLSWLATVTATTGAIAVPPLAPPWAAVLIAFCSEDEIVSAPLLDSPAVSTASARAMWSTTLMATDAPTPVSLPSAWTPVSVGAALAESACLLAAVMLLAPAPALALAPAASSAVVRSTATLIASAPATLVLAPPAPLLAVAPVVCTLASPVVPAMPAVMFSPWLATVLPLSSRASLVLVPTLIATAAPTPASFGSSLSLARVLPSAVAWASWLAVLPTVTAPVAAIVPPPTVARGRGIGHVDGDRGGDADRAAAAAAAALAGLGGRRGLRGRRVARAAGRGGRVASASRGGVLVVHALVVAGRIAVVLLAADGAGLGAGRRRAFAGGADADGAGGRDIAVQAGRAVVQLDVDRHGGADGGVLAAFGLALGLGRVGGLQAAGDADVAGRGQQRGAAADAGDRVLVGDGDGHDRGDGGAALGPALGGRRDRAFERAADAQRAAAGDRGAVIDLGAGDQVRHVDGDRSADAGVLGIGLHA